MYEIITSWPTRGMVIQPYASPPQPSPTRIQQVAPSSNSPSRSQGNCTRIRPYSSVWISSPAGPTTRATCTPRMFGLGVVSGGR